MLAEPQILFSILEKKQLQQDYKDFLKSHIFATTPDLAAMYNAMYSSNDDEKMSHTIGWDLTMLIREGCLPTLSSDGNSLVTSSTITTTGTTATAQSTTADKVSTGVLDLLANYRADKVSFAEFQKGAEMLGSLIGDAVAE